KIVDNPGENSRSVEVAEQSSLSFSVSNPAHYRDLANFQKDLQDLLTLSSYEPCGVLSESLIFSTSENSQGSTGRRKAEVLVQRAFQKDRNRKKTSHPHFLFTLKDLDFSVLLPRWFELKSAARLGFNILFGLR